MPRNLSVASTTPTTAVPSAIPWPRTFTDGLPLPKLLAFDLDYTLWPFWVDTHVTPPLKAEANGLKVKDRYGESYGFYRDVGSVLVAARQKGIKVAAASRTSAPELGREMLSLLRIPSSSGDDASGKSSGERAANFFDILQIYPGSKTTHFAKIRDASGIDYEEMLFFDDEARNRNVETLGVVMCLVRDGVTRDEIDRGVEMWRKRNRRERA
ncbi:magnesium-dependent phosphatase-1 [Phyllosticta citribraziliensis]|uniref:Magnesium-dependent phosphatase-1 n=1 Tax=Phyllosticta citribraziliensis TaxID=989973 RepID=A0ABR1MAT7_9PEZI